MLICKVKRFKQIFCRVDKIAIVYLGFLHIGGANNLVEMDFVGT